MKLETVDITTFEGARLEARRKFLEYRDAVRNARDVGQKKDDTVLMRSYREIAKGRAVLDIVSVMQSTGLCDDNWYPKLAICRADAQRCTVQMRADGSATFCAGEGRWRLAKPRRVDIPRSTFVPYTFSYGADARSKHSFALGSAWEWKDQAVAIVPTIPPEFRPPYKLEGYHLLWEAVWEPRVPVDPILLKHLGGTLFAVLAQWDLSPLEQAVLRGRL